MVMLTGYFFMPFRRTLGGFNKKKKKSRTKSSLTTVANVVYFCALITHHISDTNRANFEG